MNVNMKRVLTYSFLFLMTIPLFAQEKKKEKKEETNEIEHIYKGNEELKKDAFINAEAEYREAIGKNEKNPTAKYNLGNAYYRNNQNDNALYRYAQAQQVATTKPEKHQAFHNMGNSLMQQKKYKEAVEAYKSALRNNPKDDETRYNLALAKKMMEDEKKNKDQDNKDNKDKQDKNEDKKKQQNDQESDQGKPKDNEKDQNDGDQKDDQKDGEKDKKDKEQNKDKKNDKENPGDKKEKKQPKPQKGQLSPQQAQRLLDQMNNEEQKVQDKMNKKKGVSLETEKDW